MKPETPTCSQPHNEHYIEVLEQLERKKKLTKEEQRLAELLTLLISDYEDKHYQLKRAKPVEIVEELMRANGLRQKDLVELRNREHCFGGTERETGT